MQLYTCGNCENSLYFENNVCLNCHHPVGFDPDSRTFISLRLNEMNEYYDILHPENEYHYCENSVHGTCNWLIAKHYSDPFCLACGLNRAIPDLQNKENLNRWKRIEIAKHRLVYSLLRLNLPVKNKNTDPNKGLVFDFIGNNSSYTKVMTGHEDGVITLNIEEADEVERIRNKVELGENYRTLLGHFRHEIGHYYWDLLINYSHFLGEFRQLFGNEQQDYTQSLKNYYDSAPASNWVDYYISIYATSHPWEDWAETWAHYLHLMDTLETAYTFGIRIKPNATNEQDMQINISQDPYKTQNFDTIMKMWLPLAFAVNSLNRGMGYLDFYPFVISSPVVEKLRFIHKICGTYRF